MGKNNLIIILSLIAVIVVGAGGFYFYSKNQNSSQQQQNAVPTQSADQTGNVPTLAPADIGLSLRQSDSGKFKDHGVVITVSKLDGIATIDCEFSYTAQGNLPRGGICKSITVKSTDTTITQEYPYGTCSDVCHFDATVSDVKVIVKVTKNDGKTYQITQAL